MLTQDVRYTLRMLWKDRGFTAIAVVCLALGIGLNATIFAVVDGVLIQPFPYADPGRLVILSGVNQRLGVRQGGVSYADLRDWRELASSFTTIAGTSGRSLTISDGGEPERYQGAAISWDLFVMLGTAPHLGRSCRQTGLVPRSFYAKPAGFSSQV